MILKTIFNKIFNEKQKEKIRGMMPAYIEWYDKRIGFEEKSI